MKMESEGKCEVKTTKKRIRLSNKSKGRKTSTLICAKLKQTIDHNCCQKIEHLFLSLQTGIGQYGVNLAFQENFVFSANFLI